MRAREGACVGAGLQAERGTVREGQGGEEGGEAELLAHALVRVGAGSAISCLLKHRTLAPSYDQHRPVQLGSPGLGQQFGASLARLACVRLARSVGPGVDVGCKLIAGPRDPGAPLL